MSSTKSDVVREYGMKDRGHRDYGVKERGRREYGVAEKVRRGERVDLGDVTCPICMCILLEPIEMPCQHTICHPCYQKTVTFSTICCPLCKARLSSWSRNAAKQKTLVNLTLWKFIQEKYTEEVRSRLEGEDTIDPDEIFPCLPNHQFAAEGEIKSEFEAVMEREREEREREAREEEMKSRDLICQLQEEFEQERRQALQDEELARKLALSPSPGKENRFTPLRSKTAQIHSFLCQPQGGEQPTASAGNWGSSLVRNSSQETGFKIADKKSKSDGIKAKDNSKLSQHLNLSKRIGTDTSSNTPKSKLSKPQTLFSTNNISLFKKENGVGTRPETVVTSLQAKFNESQSLLSPDDDILDECTELASEHTSVGTNPGDETVQRCGSRVDNDDCSSSTHERESGSRNRNREPIESRNSEYSHSKNHDGEPRESYGELSGSRIYNREPSEALTNNSEPSKSMNTYGEPSKSINTNGEPRKSMKTNEPSKYMSTNGEPSKSMKTNEPSKYKNTNGEPSKSLRTNCEPSKSMKTNGKSAKPVKYYEQSIDEEVSGPIKDSIKSSAPLNILKVPLNEDDIFNTDSDTDETVSSSRKNVNLYKDSVASEEGVADLDRPVTGDMEDPEASSSSAHLFSGDGPIKPRFLEEQRLIEEQLEQEKKDLEMARLLQAQMDKEARTVDRRKGSEDEYGLRACTPGSSKRRRSSSGKTSGGNRGSSGKTSGGSKGKTARQMSIKESFKKTKLNFKDDSEVF